MLDSARLLVARRMDIEPLVRIPLPVCQEPRVWLSLPRLTVPSSRDRPLAVLSFRATFSRRVLSPRKYRSQVYTIRCVKSKWRYSSLPLSLSLSLSLSLYLSLFLPRSVCFGVGGCKMYLTGDHVSRREGEDGISSPLVKQEDRCLLRYRKSRRRAEPAGR